MTLKEFDFEKEPTVSIVKKILTDSIKMKATDIHFDPQPNEMIIKFRINGNLVEYTTAPENVKTNIITRIKILANMNITESFLPQVGAINFNVEGTSTNMRVSSLPISDGEKIVIHISNYAKNIKSISKIGLNQEDVIEIKRLLKEPQGIILVTGTASSGKTTTMYALLKEINNNSINIISIEDPIKMKIKGINQVQIAPEKGLTYKSILRNILLQDPNVICINELIDDETTRSAIRASVTGRLVLSTMHTKNAYTTIETLLNMDVENYLLGSNLIGIISQRLVKKLCPNCREKKKATDYEKKVIKYILGEDVEEIYYPKGCTDCQNGYIDQLPVVEVITIDDELRSAISNNKNHDLIRSIIYANNNSILKDGFQKVIAGETSFDEIIRITDVKIDFTKEEKEIRDFILGNGNTELDLDNIKKTTPEKIINTQQENDTTNEDDYYDKNDATEIEVTKKENEDNENNKIQIVKVIADEEIENESDNQDKKIEKEDSISEQKEESKENDESDIKDKSKEADETNKPEDNDDDADNNEADLFSDDDDEDDFNYSNYSIF